ncbi:MULTISPECIES: histidine phosphatase family protein [unclassified Exiguobacterium]|uniref:histidine phosphatase family protein n=1 Tax=unclassified Exiguobacterium TaxID=2644629 RepID=UPI001BE6D466|nr:MULTISPECIES: histidine phosphatase family protein [unclassified Exiguobacterium]
MTTIYFVRHAESPKTDLSERTRGLTDAGQIAAERVARFLTTEKIDLFYSSPYERSLLTIEGAARSLGQAIRIDENLRECVFSGQNQTMPQTDVYPLVRQMFADHTFSHDGSETFRSCQHRGVQALTAILQNHPGKRIVIGTHGMIMTAMLHHFDAMYDFYFLQQTTKPDIYRITFTGTKLVTVSRITLPLYN